MTLLYGGPRYVPGSNCSPSAGICSSCIRALNPLWGRGKRLCSSGGWCIKKAACVWERRREKGVCVCGSDSDSGSDKQ